MMFCTRIMEFDAAHRVMLHEHKCKYLHGHRYRLEASFSAPELDHVGRVIDFGEIKRILGGWVDQYWDHNVILNKEDKELGECIARITGQKIFYLKNNPTAENMASYLMDEVCPLLFKQLNINCTKITLYETPNCFVEFW